MSSLEPPPSVTCSAAASLDPHPTSHHLQDPLLAFKAISSLTPPYQSTCPVSQVLYLHPPHPPVSSPGFHVSIQSLIQDSASITTLKSRLKTHLFRQAFSLWTCCTPAIRMTTSSLLVIVFILYFIGSLINLNPQTSHWERYVGVVTLLGEETIWADAPSTVYLQINRTDINQQCFSIPEQIL